MARAIGTSGMNHSFLFPQGSDNVLFIPHQGHQFKPSTFPVVMQDFSPTE